MILRYLLTWESGLVWERPQVKSTQGAPQPLLTACLKPGCPRSTQRSPAPPQHLPGSSWVRAWTALAGRKRLEGHAGCPAKLAAFIPRHPSNSLLCPTQTDVQHTMCLLPTGFWLGSGALRDIIWGAEVTLRFPNACWSRICCADPVHHKLHGVECMGPSCTQRRVRVPMDTSPRRGCGSPPGMTRAGGASMQGRGQARATESSSSPRQNLQPPPSQLVPMGWSAPVPPRCSFTPGAPVGLGHGTVSGTWCRAGTGTLDT